MRSYVTADNGQQTKAYIICTLELSRSDEQIKHEKTCNRTDIQNAFIPSTL